MDKCKTEIDLLKEEIEQHTWTFRWLWLINLAASVWGVYSRHYDVVAIAGILAIVALIGVGLARRGKRLAERAARVCLPQRRQE